MTTFLYQGHGSFRLTSNSGAVIYVDPFAGEGYDLPADLILVTHEHGDHTQTEKMPHAQGCEILRACHFQPALGNYQRIESHGVSILGVQAYNKNHPIDACVGLVINIDNIRFYAAGDTSTTEDMLSGKLAAMNIDYATFPGDGFYNMNVQEASRCAELVAAAHSIPVHLVPVHDMSKPELFSQDAAEAFTAPGKIIVSPGQTIVL